MSRIERYVSLPTLVVVAVIVWAVVAAELLAVLL